MRKIDIASPLMLTMRVAAFSPALSDILIDYMSQPEMIEPPSSMFATFFDLLPLLSHPMRMSPKMIENLPKN